MDSIELTATNIERLKKKYSQEMKDDKNNPMKICIKLIFKAAVEKDPQRRSELANDLSKFLMKPDGIINLFLALIDFDTSSQKVTTLNQRFMAIANIIIGLPSVHVEYDDYCYNILRQLKPLLISSSQNYAQYCSLASIIVKSMIESPRAKKIDVIKLITDDLTQTESCLFKTSEAILVIYNLIRNRIPPSTFAHIFSHLFYSYILLHSTPSRLKPVIKACLLEIVNDMKPGAACCLVEKALVFPDRIYYKPSVDDDGVSIHSDLNCELDVTSLDQKLIEEILLTLLEESENELLILEFFFHFKDIAINTDDSRVRDLSTSLIERLLYSSMNTERVKLDILVIIATNPSKSIELITRTLITHITIIKDGCRSNFGLDKVIKESIESCLKILEVMNVTLRDFQETGNMKDRCVPVLKEMLNLLCENCEKFNDGRDKICNSIESLLKQLKTDEANEGCGESGSDTLESEFKSVLKDLNDKIVPVRVHALVKLKQMVLANDPLVMSQLSQIYTLIETSLADQESYVFLACINLLSEIVLRRTDEFLPKLVALYGQQDLDLQHRINVGEVLVRSTKRFREMTPFYAQQVMASMLANCRDPNELVRMSSLTNVGEVCGSLGDSLGKYMIDIMALVEELMERDSIQVKCAAMELLRTTLAGLDGLRTESIQRELKSVYNVIKRVRQRTLDDGLCLQADLCLDEMDRLARELLGQPSDSALHRASGSNSVLGSCDGTLVKNIRVLSLLEK